MTAISIILHTSDAEKLTSPGEKKCWRETTEMTIKDTKPLWRLAKRSRGESYKPTGMPLVLTLAVEEWK